MNSPRNEYARFEAESAGEILSCRVGLHVRSGHSLMAAVSWTLLIILAVCSVIVGMLIYFHKMDESSPVTATEPLPAPAPVWEEIKSGQSEHRSWDAVWKNLQATRRVEEQIPQAARESGAPLRDGNYIFFRFNGAASVKKVYLAGNFNDWAHNNGGKVRDPQFALLPAGDGKWFKRVELPPGSYKYSYVIEELNGDEKWV
ncbi:MAG: glycogen-binding domain-containing protein, partial [Verrucomicrobiota bacterium]